MGTWASRERKEKYFLEGARADSTLLDGILIGSGFRI